MVFLDGVLVVVGQAHTQFILELVTEYGDGGEKGGTPRLWRFKFPFPPECCGVGSWKQNNCRPSRLARLSRRYSTVTQPGPEFCQIIIPLPPLLGYEYCNSTQENGKLPICPRLGLDPSTT